MKKYLLCAMSLLLLCLICACSKSDETDLPVSPDDDPLVETWVDVPARQSVSYEDFMTYVVGYGWKETQFYEMNDDATQYNNVPYTLYGWSPSRYVFGNGMMRGFYYLDHIPCNVYGDSPMQYEANKIYVGNNEKFTLISVDDTEIRAIEKAGLIDDHAGGMKTVYHYVVLQRMTDKELQETRDTYWVNAKDLSRPMTREDLIHKWVLMTYTDNHIATHVSNDRNVDKAYIQFFEDGTVTVKDGVGVAAYKGTFDIQFNNNESATISLKFADAKRAGGFFQKNVWQSTELRLTAAAYLTLAIDEGTGFFLQRYPINDTNVDDPRSNPDDSDMLYPLYSSNIINWGENSRTWHYENVGYWKVLIDEGGRYRGGYFWGFDKPDEPLEELYAAPSSIEELNGFLYTLDDDYELRLDTIEVYNPDYYGFPRRGEFYHEYYKGVRVFGGGYSYHITETPQGERIYCATGQIITFEPLDVVPTLTAQQALETFSKYQKEPIDPSWVCQLLIREYNIKTEIDEVYAKLARREHRLVYIVVGPEYEYRDRDNMIRKARVRADIDAHTGQIIVVESGII